LNEQAEKPSPQTKQRNEPTGHAMGQVKVEKGGWWGGTLFVARAAYHHY